MKPIKLFVAASKRAPKLPGILYVTVSPYLPKVDVVRVPFRMMFSKASAAAVLIDESVENLFRNVPFVNPTTSGCLLSALPTRVKSVALCPDSALLNMGLATKPDTPGVSAATTDVVADFTAVASKEVPT